MKPELSGKCILKINTGKSSLTTEIPKLNDMTGENNADALIGEVFHFAIKRHGIRKFLEMAKDRAAMYGGEE